MASVDAQREERIATIAALAAARKAQAPLALDAFAAETFRQVDLEDLQERTPEDLLGELLSHAQWGQQRAPRTAKVRVLNPSPAEDGWGSRHTIVQVVNDDMPFLVDSVSLEIARHGFTLHLIVHPVFAVQRDAAGVLQRLAPRAAEPQWPRES